MKRLLLIIPVKTPEGKAWAKKIYVSARPNYHSVAYNSIDELLK